MQQLLDYIRGQPQEIVLNIISDEDACRTYVKLLPPLSQQILFRLLLIPNGFPVEEILKWSPDQKTITDAYSELNTSYLVSSETITNKLHVKINSAVREVLLGFGSKTGIKFQESKPKLVNPFLQQEPKPSIGRDSSIDESPVIPENVLDEFAKKQLETILSFMLQLSEDIDPEAQKILSDAGLIEYGNNLTPEGHRFLLMSPKEQIWKIVVTYLGNTKDIVSSIKFILQIGSMQLTHGYPISKLPSFLEALLRPFNAIGLVYIMRDYFYPTKSILNFFGKSDIFKNEGWMFIDTNFKITAFPKSNLDAALLKKFAIVTYEFPGFASAFISPKSFREALDKGTTLDDIISFLKANISKKIGSGLIPDTVLKQLQVWKNQRERLTITPKCIMRQYSSQDQATAAASVAQELGGLVFGPSYIESSRFYTVVTRHEIEDNYKPYLEQMQNSFTYY